MVDLALDLLDERQHVAHAENARCQTIWMKRIEGISFLSHTQKFNRTLGDSPHRQSRSAAGVRVHLGQDDAC